MADRGVLLGARFVSLFGLFWVGGSSLGVRSMPVPGRGAIFNERKC